MNDGVGQRQAGGDEADYTRGLPHVWPAQPFVRIKHLC
jgi:hypothetical protein